MLNNCAHTSKFAYWLYSVRWSLPLFQFVQRLSFHQHALFLFSVSEQQPSGEKKERGIWKDLFQNSKLNNYTEEVSDARTPLISTVSHMTHRLQLSLWGRGSWTTVVSLTHPTRVIPLVVIFILSFHFIDWLSLSSLQTIPAPEHSVLRLSRSVGMRKTSRLLESVRIHCRFWRLNPTTHWLTPNLWVTEKIETPYSADITKTTVLKHQKPSYIFCCQGSCFGAA